ncbi:cytoplasmic protein [Solemya pervernicosa gill symbiont]|uniref:Cytoplasmic protein n=1 Tax=Solemya pervernicosa gill symbiont TaxID=642797 RepID=A0A1T2L5F2_9GAMM|nr:type II toxin-antitoxin system RelE/ParE family toxin [Solemya pervernicosa gill symbiont]OOZ40270.1 cytoplasmic protein [Solemya pervernicosa gill symbiont]
MDTEKPITWIGSSRDDLLKFPVSVKRSAGYQLHRLQHGLKPSDFKPFSQVGPGTYEVRIRDSSGIFRTIYVAKFDEAVYVLHAFQKKSQRTPKQDIEIATDRYQAVLKHRKMR